MQIKFKLKKIKITHWLELTLREKLIKNQSWQDNMVIILTTENKCTLQQVGQLKTSYIYTHIYSSTVAITQTSTHSYCI